MRIDAHSNFSNEIDFQTHEVPMAEGGEAHPLSEGGKLPAPPTGTVSRRDLLKRSGTAFLMMALMDSPLFGQIWKDHNKEQPVPFLDEPPPPPEEAIAHYGELNKLKWPELTSWVTPTQQFFDVSHYNRPVLDGDTWRLHIGGLIDRPLTLSLEDLKALPRQEVLYTLECAGNHGFEWFVGGIGTAKWTGTPLAPLLRKASVQAKGMEVVFFGSDAGEEEVRGTKIPQSFSRSLSLTDALEPSVLLCYEMNGEPLPYLHGFPVRLIVPGWYGVANVKWLARIEVMDTRWAGRFMAKDYVTVRQESGIDGKPEWTQKVVGRTLIKSLPAKITTHQGRYRMYGAAWGGAIQRVEVRIDQGPWRSAIIDQGQDHPYAWKFWHWEWEHPTPGRHTVTSRAVAHDGTIQPAPDHPSLAQKLTYWESNGQITRQFQVG